MIVKLPAYAWYGDYEISIELPDNWEVNVFKMKGHDAPRLTEDQISKKLSKPINSEPLHELAKNKKECVIIVDDLTRPTKAYQLIPHVLKELHEGGIKDENIRFVMAIGAHHLMRLDDIKKKLGDEIPEKYNVFNHNVFENHVFLGKTSNGTPIYINKEVMRCDLKIGIGSIIPHLSFGYGGGGKIILPGVSSIETITYNHIQIKKGIGVGCIEENLRRLDAEEAARMAGLDFVVNALVNPNRDCCELVCGDPIAAHREGVKIAKKHYITETVEADIVIVNGYPMENEAYKVFDIANRSLKEGGDLIVMIHTPEGQRGHYYSGRFGTDYGGKGWRIGLYTEKLKRFDNFYVIAPHDSLIDHQYFGLDSRWFKSFEGALKDLKLKHGGKEVRVAIYPYAPIQISKDDASRL